MAVDALITIDGRDISVDGTALDTAVGWGNHAGLYDAAGTAATGDSAHLSTYNHANFVTAFGWGNHAGLYDDAGDAAAAVSTHESTFNHATYDTAYGWGDHASGGYLKANGTVPLTADWTTGAFSIVGSDHWYLQADNAKMFFGEGDDASIHYDGVDLVIEPSLVGSGAVSIQGAGGATTPLLHITGTTSAEMELEAAGADEHVQFQFKTVAQQWNFGVYPTLDESIALFDNTNEKHVMMWHAGVTPSISIRQDSSKLFWGVADDCSVMYDGTNMVLSPSEVGNGAVLITGAAGVSNPLLRVVGTDHTAMRFETTGAGKQAQFEFKIPTQQWNFGANVSGPLVVYNSTNPGVVTRWNTGATPGFDLPRDDLKVSLGIASDCSIVYDGTNMVINPKEVGIGILDVLGVLQTDGYNSADGTAGATASVAVAKVGGGTRTLDFKDGLYTGFTDS